MNQKRSKYGQGESGSGDEWDEGFSSSDGEDDMRSSSKRSKKSGRSSVARSRIESNSLAEERERARCFLCKIGLFCDISTQSKTVPIVKLEAKIREIIHRFINVNNSDIMMTDMRDLLNDELRVITTEQMDMQYTDLTLKDVKTHFFDCIIEPVLQARKSFDYWNSLFEKGSKLVLKIGEDGEPFMDDKQVSTLAKIDAQRNASMYPKDPRQSIFFINGLSAIPKNLNGTHPSRPPR